MGEGPVDHENVASRLVEDTLTVAVEKNRLSKECGTLGSDDLHEALKKIDVQAGDDEEIIEEVFHEHDDKVNLTNDSEVFRDSLEDDDRPVSESSEKSSKSRSSSSSSTSTSSSSSSNSSRSTESLNKTKPSRFAQTFKKGDLIHELNKTRVLDKNGGTKSSGIPTLGKSSSKATKSSPKVNSWIDPKSVKGNSHDTQRMKDWIAKKEKKKQIERQEAKRKKKEAEEREREEYEMKEQLQKKNFEQWESKKKTLLEQKIKQSKELKARRKEKELEQIEKQKYSEKAFQSWKSRKDENNKEERDIKEQKKKEEKDEKTRLMMEKERDQKKSFERWCQAQAEAEERKREAQRKAKEAEEELELLQEYRKRDAEEEYIQWKKEKSLNRSAPPKPAQHPLGWAPAGKSDGKHRISPNFKPSSPGEPLSKTLASLQNGPTYHRKLKTVEVCCRKISFWCHCQSDVDCHGSLPHEFHNGSFQRSRSQPVRTSTPNGSPKFSRHPHFGDLDTSGSHGYNSPIQLSRHTTPVSSRPSTPRHR